MNHLSLFIANAEIARRVTDAEQWRRARGCRTWRPLADALPRRADRR